MLFPSPSQPFACLKTLAAKASLIAMLGGVAVLAGWALDPELLRRLSPGREATKPIGALGLLCAGVALLLLRPAERVSGSWRRGLGFACSGVALAIGVLTLIEQGLDVDLGIDRLLFASALSTEAGPHPGRAVFPIPLCLALLGLALTALPSKRARFADPLAGLALFVGLLVMVGYLYDAVPFSRAEPPRPVPVVSTVLVIVLALGCLAARPGSALVRITTSRGAGGVAARRLLPAVVLLPFFLGLLRLLGQRLGLYGTEFGLALFATLNMTVFIGLVAASARRLEEIEASREDARAALLESEARAADEIRSLNASLERRVSERTRQLSRAQEMAHLGSWELDLVNDSLHWSDEVYRIFGLAPQQFEANYAAFLEAVHPEDREAVDAAYSGSIRDGRDAYEIEHRIVRPGGEVRMVHEKCEHFRGEKGRVVRSTGMVHDITARRMAEDSLRRTAAELSAALEHKEALLKEIHHRVKNNMQVVCSLLRLQSDAVPDARVREVLAESHRRVRAMALLHEQLYRSTDLARIDFGCYVRSLVSFLRRSLAPGGRQVEIGVDVDGVLLDMERAMPLGLLVSELVSNSLKHAFPPEEGAGSRAGQVWVAARREPSGGLALVVGDDGAGLPEDVDIRSSPSMGLKLVSSFVDQLRGSLAVERRGGTVVTVTVPRNGA